MSPLNHYLEDDSHEDDAANESPKTKGPVRSRLRKVAMRKRNGRHRGKPAGGLHCRRNKRIAW